MKKKYLKIKYLLIGFAIFILTLPIYWQTVATWSIKMYCWMCFDGILEIEDVRFDKHHWVLKHPTISIQDHVIFDAKEITIGLNYTLWVPKVDLDAKVIKPMINFEELGTLDYPRITPTFLPITTHIATEEGKIYLPGIDGERDIEIDGTLGKEIALKISINQEKYEQMTLDYLSTSSKQSKLNISFVDIHSPAFLTLFSSKFPQLQDKAMKEGTVNGNFTWQKSGKREFNFKGQMEIVDFAMSIDDGHLEINQAFLQFEGNKKKQSIKPTYFAKLDIVKEGTLYKNDDWQLRNLKGSIEFDEQETLKFALVGDRISHSNEDKFRIEGECHIGTQNLQNSEVLLSFGEKSRLQVQAMTDSLSWESLHLQTQQFSVADLSIIREFASKSIPQLERIRFIHGTVDMDLSLIKDLNQSVNINLERFESENLEFALTPWQVEIRTNSLSGAINGDVNKGLNLNTISGSLSVDGGIISINHGFELKNINTEIFIDDGSIRHTKLYGSLRGMEALAEIDMTKDPAVNFSFSGTPKLLDKIFPPDTIKNIERVFSEDKLDIQGQIYNKRWGMQLKGQLRTTEESISYGVDTITQKNLIDQNENLSLDFIQSLYPELEEFLEPILGMNNKNRSYSIRNGWFHAQDIELNKYIAPFIFPENQMTMTGKGNFYGSFDERGVVLHYSTDGLVLENKDLIVSIDKLVYDPQKERDQYNAMHYFDFVTKKHIGVFPVAEATYLQKNRDLLFTDISAHVIIEGKKIHIPEVDALSNGLYLAGAIEMDFSPPEKGVFDVDVQSHTVYGLFSEVQAFLSHFDTPPLVLKLPLEGDVSYRQGEGGALHFHFYPGDFDLTAHFQGGITNGNMESSEISISDLSLQFDYDHTTQTFDMYDLDGILTIGKEGKHEEFSIAGDHVRFTNYIDGAGDFDIWVGDRKRDIIRIVGVMEPYKDQSVKFIIDKDITHFGDVHPHKLDLILKNQSQVELFDLELSFQLKSLFHDIQKVNRSGLVIVPQSMADEIDQLKDAQGQFKIQIHYDDQTDVMTYTGEGEDIAIGKHLFKNCLLQGKKKESTWVIDQLQLDNLSFAADFLKENDFIQINFLGLRAGKSILLGLEGQYDLVNNILDARVNLLEIQLEHLNEWPFFYAFFNKTSPKGLLRGSGEIHLEHVNQWHGEAIFNTSIRSCHFFGFNYQDADNISCHLKSNRGITFRNIVTGLLGEDGQHHGAIELDKFDYDMNYDEVILDGLHFHIPIQNLRWLAKKMQKNFPEAVNSSIAEIITQAKTSGVLEGALSLDIASPHGAFTLALDEGNYFFHGREYTLKNFFMEYDPFILKMTTQVLQEQKWLSAELSSTSPQIENGNLYIKDNASNGKGLQVIWEMDPEFGFQVKKAEGSVSGLDIHLVRDKMIPLNADEQHLTGSIAFNGRDAALLFDQDLSHEITELDVGGGYQLKGKWSMGNRTIEGVPFNLFFDGHLSGKNFIFKGYQFEDLQAEVSISPTQIIVKNVDVRDPSGQLSIQQIDVNKHHGEGWIMGLTPIVATDFRPSLLRLEGAPPNLTPKALVIKKLELTNLMGQLNDSSSFRGTGKLRFSNPAKRNLQNTIFAIPAEIISRIGLDTSVLTPVTGNIFFDIRDGKVILTRFKDVYSEGRLSKFYLPDTVYEPYMDFQGNLHLQVRMKQYNLVFKLAELFTVTIGGTIHKPSYSLQKQNRMDLVIQ